VVYVPTYRHEERRVIEYREVEHRHDDWCGHQRGPSDKERVQQHMKQGWQALEDEDFLKARREFGAAVDIKPKGGMPNLGLALAHGALGDHDDAESAIRLAFAAELPDDLKLDKKHKDLLEDLADHYQRSARQSRDADAWFMLAAAQHLRDLDHAAEGALFNAVDYGGEDRSTRCLADRLAPDGRDVARAK
jgi:thioredoxin-like negative regulator of GroEL